MISNGIRFMFLRNQSGAPVGCLAIDINFRTITYGWSVLNPRDKFDRRLAREIAQGRLEKTLGLEFVKLPISNTGKVSMHDISRAVMHHLATNKLAPTRARKAATLWLTSVPTV